MQSSIPTTNNTGTPGEVKGNKQRIGRSLSYGTGRVGEPEEGGRVGVENTGGQSLSLEEGVNLTLGGGTRRAKGKN